MKGLTDNQILCLIAALCAAATVVVAFQPRAAKRSEVARDFQSALGGLGMGCQLDLTSGSWWFDPRIAGDEASGFESLATAGELSPWQGLSLFPAPDPLSPPR